MEGFIAEGKLELTLETKRAGIASQTGERLTNGKEWMPAARMTCEVTKENDLGIHIFVPDKKLD